MSTNRIHVKIKLALWIIVTLGLIATLPLAFQRMQVEKSANEVQLVFDYSDLISISHYKPNPQDFINEHLVKLKESGVNAMSVFESTLTELEQHRRIQMLTAHEAALFAGDTLDPNVNFTYLLFTSKEAERELKPMIERSFAARDIKTGTWSQSEHSGMVIHTAIQEAIIVPLEPDPIAMQLLYDRGFEVVVRLSDNRPFHAEQIDDLLARLEALGVRWIIFSGDQVTGYGDDEKKDSLTQMAEMMNKYGIGLVHIEMLKKPQKGLAKLARLTDYQVVRLHSIQEGESGQAAEKLADRMALAVKDRNVRMIYINAQAKRDSVKAELSDTMKNIYKTLNGDQGAVERIKANGFVFDHVQPFHYETLAFNKWLKLLVYAGAVALMVLLASVFFPKWTLAWTVLAYLGAGGIYVLSQVLATQAVALGAAIAAPSLAIILAIRRVNHAQAQAQAQPGRSISGITGKSLILFIRTIAVALLGAGVVVGLLNDLTYMLVLEQFRGVNLLKLTPLAIVAVYYLFFRNAQNMGESWQRVVALLKANIKVGYVVAIGAIGLVGIYYLSRAGNAGQSLPFEPLIRAFLEQTLGVRPRTQEFLIGHPLLLFGAYLSFKYRHAGFLLIFATVGVLNMVGTFAHLHTPLWISLVRSLYGILFGAAIGFVCILIWNLVERNVRKWLLKRS